MIIESTDSIRLTNNCFIKVLYVYVYDSMPSPGTFLQMKFGTKQYATRFTMHHNQRGKINIYFTSFIR